MMNKKSKKAQEKENVNIQSKHSFTPFTNLRRSFKRLKQRREQRAQSVDSILDKENTKNTSKDTGKKLSDKNGNNSQNLLRRIASGKRFRRKNVQSMITSSEEIRKFNVVEWSSCESLSDNFEKKVQKHNSLRRSKASLLMPVSGNIHDCKKLSPPSTKITRYSSMNAINENNKVKVDNKWFSSQQNVSDVNSGNNNNIKYFKQKAEKNNSGSIYEKRKKPKGRKNESLSLPNICEDNLDERAVDIEVDKNNLKTKCENAVDTKVSHRFSTDNIFTGNINNLKRGSLIVLSDNNESLLYGSSPVLDRPPLPSAPKPTTRRDRLLRKSVSTEAISPRKRRADCCFKFNQRTLSDYNLGNKTELCRENFTEEYSQNPEDKSEEQDVVPEITIEKEEIHQNCSSRNKRFSLCASMNDLPSFIMENQNIWKRSMASYVSNKSCF